MFKIFRCLGKWHFPVCVIFYLSGKKNFKKAKKIIIKQNNKKVVEY